MKRKIIITIVIILIVAGVGVGSFFIIKTIIDENHKKDIEMAADCAQSFEMPIRRVGSGFYENLRIEQEYNNEVRNRQITKRQECAEKYHVTHQEIIDKIRAGE
jgi:hypothetical protein